MKSKSDIKKESERDEEDADTSQRTFSLLNSHISRRYLYIKRLYTAGSKTVIHISSKTEIFSSLNSSSFTKQCRLPFFSTNCQLSVVYITTVDMMRDEF